MANPYDSSQLSAPTASSDGSLYKAPGALDGSGSFLPRIVQVDSSTGCTLTNASIKGMTPAEFENLGNKEIDLARVIASAAEAKILGVQEKGLPALLRSSITNIKPLLNQQKVETQSLILPYIQRRQRSYINSNYFTATNGQLSPLAAQNNNHAGLWQVTVGVTDSPWSTAIAAVERYFLPGSTVLVQTWDNGNDKNAKSLVFTVQEAEASGSNATLTLVPNVTTTTYAGLTDAQKGAYGFTVGVLQTGANSVNDYEEWCYNQPADLSQQLIVNWLQTTRESRIVDDQYKATLDSIMSGKVNPFLQKFVYQPIAEQNKRASQLSDEAWMRSLWYGQKINENQTPETYMNLPEVLDPEGARTGSASFGSDCVLEYKANALGIHTQLSDANRIADLNGGVLDLDYLFEQLYLLKRHREADGDSISVIDVMTDRITANNIFTVMNNYYSTKYNWDVTRNVAINEKITHDGIMLFNYNKYDIPEVGVQLAVFHDQFFDDLISATPNTFAAAEGTDTPDTSDDVAAIQGFKSRSRALWLLDWSDIRVGIAGTNSVTRRNPAPEVMDAYRCRMNAVIKEYSLRSTTWTTMLDRPQRHLIIQNFSDANPTVTTG
jgi:hypothetical protein